MIRVRSGDTRFTDRIFQFFLSFSNVFTFRRPRGRFENVFEEFKRSEEESRINKLAPSPVRFGTARTWSERRPMKIRFRVARIR